MRAPLGVFGKEGCPECGMRAGVDPDHELSCSRRPGPGPYGAAMHELAACGSDLATLVIACAAGWLLRIGPTRVDENAKVLQWRGELRDPFVYDSRPGRVLVADGVDVLEVIVQLAEAWRRHR